MAGEGKGKEPFLDEKPSGEACDGEINEICIEIKKLCDKSSRSSSDSSIFKVPSQLRRVKESAYEPRINSIGPYHRGNPHLKAMEFHKWSYFDKLLKRTNGDSAMYVEAMKNLENDARRCYAESLDHMSSQEFVQMLVLDGFFIIEVIREFNELSPTFEEDGVFRPNCSLFLLGQELLLVENQLPFFVLKELFNMTKTESEGDEDLVKMALKFFTAIVKGAGIPVIKRDRRTNQIKHLIGLVHDNWLPSSEELISPSSEEILISRLPEELMKSNKKDVKYTYWNSIRSAKELLEFGIKFKKVTGDIGFFDIKFEKGRLKIPTLTIYHDTTERVLRNLIAYEQFNEGGTNFFMDYARFMDGLINYVDDVELLSQCGIIRNCLGNNEEVARMFNELNDFVYSTAQFDSSYCKIFLEVSKYCKSRLWRVNLRDKYFRTPWDWVLASIVAGGILLLLALIQTVFTVLSYVKQ